MIVNDQKLAKIIKDKVPVTIQEQQYYIIPSPSGTCDGCVFLEKACPQKAITICTSNGGNILVKNKPQ